VEHAGFEPACSLFAREMTTPSSPMPHKLVLYLYTDPESMSTKLEEEEKEQSCRGEHPDATIEQD